MTFLILLKINLKNNMSKWTGKSKGTVLGYRIFIFSIKTFGVKTAYFILHFVTNYYFLFAKKNKEGILNFYKQALGFNDKKAKQIARKNFYIFGQTLVDRHAFLLNKAKHITYSFDNEQALIDIKESNKGAVLLSGHIGNWETAGNLLKDRISNKINVLMLDAEYQEIKQFIDDSTGGSKFNVIAIKNDLSHIIKIKNSLSNNEFIAIHADRTTDSIKNIEIDFFGIPTKFPYGPFLIASKFKVPVVFVFAVKGNENHYSLNCTNPTVGESPKEIAKKYIAELERMVRKYPEQWFNYYNYFE